tara:strand:+ start:217 stop:834 length:618 start_codon:yes stop_codon:yes gene_type:complete
MKETRTISLPEDISDITLSQYQRLVKLQDREDLDQEQLTKRVIMLFTGMKYRELTNIVYTDYQMIVSSIFTALKIVDVPFEKTFVLNGVEYGFIQNLDKMTQGEYIDLTNEPMTTENMHEKLAVLCRPVVGMDNYGMYTIETYNGTGRREEVMLQCPMNVVNGLLGFFRNLSVELKNSILKSTAKLEVQRKKQRDTFKNGDGTQH